MWQTVPHSCNTVLCPAEVRSHQCYRHLTGQKTAEFSTLSLG
jgi:hypothetical protein